MTNRATQPATDESPRSDLGAKPIRSAGRIPGLDALRGLAAVGVAIHHYKLYFDAGPDLPVLYPVYHGASFLVDLFFVLSGFLLTQVYADVKSFRELAIRSVARLFPLQWATLLVVLIGQQMYSTYWGKPFIYPINDGYHFFLNFVLLQQSGLQTGFSFNGPSWSISVEWIINLLFFWLLLKPRLLPSAALAIALLSGALLASSQTTLGAFGKSYGFVDAALLRVAFGFFVGVVAAGVFTRLNGAARASRLWDAVAIACGLAFIAFLASKPLNSRLDVQIVVIGIVIPLMVLGCAQGTHIRRLLGLRPLTWLGDISYSVYLMHFPILLGVFGLRNHLPLPLNSGEGLVATLCLILLLSHLTFRGFELPAQRALLSRLRPRT